MFFAMILSSGAIPCLGPLCLLCLVLLFFESSFGICLGCKMYNLFTKDEAQLCPGGVCEIRKKEEIQKINIFQIVLTIILLGSIMFSFKAGFITGNNNVACGIGDACPSEKNNTESNINTPCPLMNNDVNKNIVKPCGSK